MRLRNNPDAMPFLEEHADLVFINPREHFGKWKEVFGNDHPIAIEIGMGKGDFIIENARRNPDINFIGIEKYSTVLTIAVKKYLDGETLPNLCFMKEDAAVLNEVFAESEIDTIYLNFSDPWPKKRHAKRRLTYSTFLDVYKLILKEGGHLIFKTDNRPFFEYSLVSMNNYGAHFFDVCLDLHHSDGYEDNVMTEYEKKFSPYGPIYRIDIDFGDHHE